MNRRIVIKGLIFVISPNDLKTLKEILIFPEFDSSHVILYIPLLFAWVYFGLYFKILIILVMSFE